MSPDATGVRRSRAAGATVLAVALLASLIPLAAPAGANSKFTDHESSEHRQAIEYLEDRGVTEGCNPPKNDRFCPDRLLTRGEMATLLVRAFDLDDSNRDAFRDDSGNVHASNINALAAAGITHGCNPPADDRYCPNGHVTRGQMSAFVNRLLPLSAGSARFDDVAGSVFADDIAAIARVGITQGCNPPADTKFCPDRAITRAEVATFLMRAMEIERTGTTTTTTGGGGGGGGESPPSNLPDVCRALSSVPNGPDNPTGVRIPAGSNIQKAVNGKPAGTTFVLEKGVYKNQTVAPRNGDKFIGQPGAVMDGGGSTEYAFGSGAANVLIEGIEITGYKSPVGDGKGVIRSAGGAKSWTIRANEIHHNLGSGISIASGFKIIGNFLHHNQEYAIVGIGTDVLVEGNRLANNQEYGPKVGGDAGGTKFIRTVRLVVRGNCSHDNNGPGLWTDGGNIDTLYEGNMVVDNTQAGIKHEVSCRATIRNNTLVGNGFGQKDWVNGAGILIPNSRDVTITGNIVRGNNDGIGAVWYPRQNQKHVNCQWELKNLRVEGNRIEMDRGETGIARGGGAGNEVYHSWNNEFRNNEYVLSPSNGGFFRWIESEITYSEWKAHGQS